MSGKCRPSLRDKTLCNVECCNLSQTDKNCIKAVFDKFEEQKAENKKLKESVKRWKEKYKLQQVVVNDYTKVIYKQALELYIVKTEAVKEFADLVIKTICEKVSAPIPSESCIVEKCNEIIDNLVKEMVGDNNA